MAKVVSKAGESQAELLPSTCPNRQDFANADSISESEGWLLRCLETERQSTRHLAVVSEDVDAHDGLVEGRVGGDDHIIVDVLLVVQAVEPLRRGS